jgi:hypothetical protein
VAVKLPLKATEDFVTSTASVTPQPSSRSRSGTVLNVTEEVARTARHCGASSWSRASFIRVSQFGLSDTCSGAKGSRRAGMTMAPARTSPSRTTTPTSAAIDSRPSTTGPHGVRGRRLGRSSLIGPF